MLQSNFQASKIAVAFAASACTDITGFGLLGHLSEMLGDSGIGAVLKLSQLPLLSGVSRCMARGIQSTMYEANLWVEKEIHNRETFRSHSSYPVLFDPQTSGGLLFSIDSERSAGCITALKDAGYLQAVIIGKAIKGNIFLE